MPADSDRSRTRFAPAALRALLELGVLLVGPVTLLGAVYFAWVGPARVAMLVVLGVAVALLGPTRARLTPILGAPNSRLARFVLAALVLWLFTVHAQRFARDIGREPICLTDMGRPSICAGQWLLEGQNPWATCLPDKYKPTRAHKKHDTFNWCLSEGRCVDRKAGGSYEDWKDSTGLGFMNGYKYGPLLALIYLPTTHLWRETGLYAVNLGFWLLELGLLVVLARRAFPALPAAGMRALLVFLLPAALPVRTLLPEVLHFVVIGKEVGIGPPSRVAFVRELTVNCANDVIPVTLGLLALWLASSRRSLAAGVVLGLSLATKQLPGLLLLPLVARLDGVRWQRVLLGAVLTATLLYLPFFAWAPEEMFANLVRFHMERPANRSGLLRFLAPGAQSLMSLVQLALAVVLLWHYGSAHATERNLSRLLRTATLLLVSFVALNKVVHGNYLLWILPFSALCLSAVPFAARGAGDQARPEYAAPP